MDFITLVLLNLVALLLGIGGIGYINDRWREGEYTRNARQVFHGIYVSTFIMAVMIMIVSLLPLFGRPVGMTEGDWMILAAEYIFIIALGCGLSVYTFRFYKECKRGFYL